VKQRRVNHVVILSGDQLYRMDFRKMLAMHVEAGADVSIAAKPVDASQASQLGIMRINESGRVVGFVEKPQTDEELAEVHMDPAWLDAQGIESGGRNCLASMGIYLFNRDVLVDLLENTDHEDFGREVFPNAINTKRVQVHVFDGYWEDIGTIRSFYEANLALASAKPPFALASPTGPLYTRPRFLPPTRADGATIRQSLIADGCLIEEGVTIENSVIGLRCHICRNVTIRDSILMGADYYDRREGENEKQGRVILPFSINDGSTVINAIVDKNCQIGRDVRIANSRGIESKDIDANCVIRDGIVVVKKYAVVPDGWQHE